MGIQSIYGNTVNIWEYSPYNQVINDTFLTLAHAISCEICLSGFTDNHRWSLLMIAVLLVAAFGVVLSLSVAGVGVVIAHS